MVNFNDIKDVTNQTDSVVNSDEQNWLYSFAIEQAQQIGHEGLTKGLGHIGNIRDGLFNVNLALQADTERWKSRNFVDDPDIFHLREDKGENWQHEVTFHLKNGKKEVIIYVQPPNAYPIIFIPDFMGSNLKNSNPKSDERVWNADLRGNMADVWEKIGADKRKRLLEPSSVMVDQDGQVPEHGTFSQEKMKERGWGSVSYYLYGPFLSWLDDRMNDFEDAEVGVRAKMAELSDNSAEPTEIGDRMTNERDEKKYQQYVNEGFDPRASQIINNHTKKTINIYSLTKEQYKQSYHYRYPVYAFGYNWMLGNDEIATNLKEFITKTLQKEIQRIGNKGDISQVILVTHGSGGLIARKFAKDNPGLVKGVVFGAMPATGIPETYKRIKNGSKAVFEQAAKQAIVEASQQTAGNFISETLFPAMIDSANYAPALVAGLFAFEGGPFAMFTVASSVYAANVIKSTTIRGSVNATKETLIATDTIKDQNIIEGRNAEDVAVIAAESVGYLQTLPFNNYPTKAWLLMNLPLELEPPNYYNAMQFDAYALRQATKKPKTIAYPQIDPFTEIYLSSDEKGLYNTETMNFGILKGDKLYTEADPFKKIVEFQVKTFQNEIKDFYPHPFYIFSGILPLSGAVSSVQVSSSVSAKDFLPGDGIVPYVSAKPAHDAAEQDAVFCFEHHKAFFDEATRLFVVSCVTKIATTVS